MNTSIVICGQKFDIGTRVVLWNEPGGLNGYSEASTSFTEEDRKTGKQVKKTISGRRYGKRSIKTLDLGGLKNIVTQFFLHHSGLYHSSTTFNVLHNERKLSVHFIMDDNGTLYQTLDLVECAWHGGSNNKCSVGIEIDSRAMAGTKPDAYDEYHQKKHSVLPHKKRVDKVQKQWLLGYEYTDIQYKALIKLAITLTSVFPKLSVNNVADFPRATDGRVAKSVISNPTKHCGFICHFQSSANKVDPISFDFGRFLNGVKTFHTDQPSSFISFVDVPSRQKILQQLGFDPGPIDGDFGPMSNKALKDFQTKNGISEDGWGEKTDYMIDWLLK